MPIFIKLSKLVVKAPNVGGVLDGICAGMSGHHYLGGENDVNPDRNQFTNGKEF